MLFPGVNTVTLAVDNRHGITHTGATVNYTPVANGTVVKLIGIGMTQATQDSINSVPLIAGKPTVVRLYFTDHRRACRDQRCARRQHQRLPRGR